MAFAWGQSAHSDVLPQRSSDSQSQDAHSLQLLTAEHHPLSMRIRDLFVGDWAMKEKTSLELYFEAQSEEVLKARWEHAAGACSGCQNHTTDEASTAKSSQFRRLDIRVHGLAGLALCLAGRETTILCAYILSFSPFKSRGERRERGWLLRHNAKVHNTHPHSTYMNIQKHVQMSPYTLRTWILVD